MRGADLEGWVRLGLQEDLGESLLPGVLGRFARAHPRVGVEACVARSADLRERLALGQLDLALTWEVAGSAPLDHAEQLVRLPLGLSARPAFGLPPHVRVLERAGTGLPALPQIALSMARAQAEPEAPVARLADLLREAVRESVTVR